MKACIVMHGALCALALTAPPGAVRLTEINVTPGSAAIAARFAS